MMRACDTRRGNGKSEQEKELYAGKFRAFTWTMRIALKQLKLGVETQA